MTRDIAREIEQMNLVFAGVAITRSFGARCAVIIQVRMMLSYCSISITSYNIKLEAAAAIIVVVVTRGY